MGSFVSHPLVVFIAGVLVGVLFDAKIRGAATAASSKFA